MSKDNRRAVKFSLQDLLDKHEKLGPILDKMQEGINQSADIARIYVDYLDETTDKDAAIARDHAMQFIAFIDVILEGYRRESSNLNELKRLLKDMLSDAFGIEIVGTSAKKPRGVPVMSPDEADDEIRH